MCRCVAVASVCRWHHESEHLQCHQWHWSHLWTENLWGAAAAKKLQKHNTFHGLRGKSVFKMLKFSWHYMTGKQNLRCYLTRHEIGRQCAVQADVLQTLVKTKKSQSMLLLLAGRRRRSTFAPIQRRLDALRINNPATMVRHKTP